MNPRHPVMQQFRHYPLFAAALVSFLWLALGSGGGYLAVNLISGHGSIVFAPLGVGVGVIGAVCHVVALGQPSFLARPRWHQALLVGIAATVAAVLAGFAIGLVTERSAADAASMGLFVLLMVSLPALLVAFVSTYAASYAT